MEIAQFFPFLLFLHVMGAILAFGPTFAFSIMGSMAGKEPQHANFSARQVAMISNRLVYPLVIFQGITGLLLIWAGNINLMDRTWLLIAHRAVPHRPGLRRSPCSGRRCTASSS